MNRRSFLQLLGGTAVATAVAPIIPEAAQVDLPFTSPPPSAKATGKLIVRWNPIEDASHYEVLIKRGNDYITRALTEADRFVFTDKLEKGKQHHISVRAVYATGDKSSSQDITVEGQEYDPTDYDWPGDID